ncbi:hypothetical protein A3863_17590 [Priestia endophytica]|uniref:MFS transporter n=1 Tax=Priestia endophytica TaxID=135735 RepID=UPI000DCA4135|nr:MFS transporter [Priestia endophytica]RAS86612.1 hypothetical protein A3863_17590 [Priestia endophytica]
MFIYILVALFLIYQTSIRGNTLLLTLYAIDLHASAFYLSMIVATTSLFPMLFAAYAGRVSDRIGFRLPFIAGMLGTCIALLLPYLFPHQLFILLISQSLFGLCQIFTIVTMQNLIGALSNKENRSYYFSTHSLGVAISNFLGPLITGFSIEHFHFTHTYLLLAVISIIPSFFFLFRWIKLPTPTIHKQKQSSNFIKILIAPSLRKTFITSGIILTGVGIYEFYFPIYAQSIGLSAAMIGIIISCNAVAYILSRLLMTPLLKKFKGEAILGTCLSISAIAFFLIPLFDNLPLLIIISFVMGLGLGCCQPLSIVMAYSHSPQGRTGEVLGIRLTINKSVQFLVPIIFGSLGSLLGFFPVFWSNAALLLFSGYSLFERKNKSPRTKFFNR